MAEWHSGNIFIRELKFAKAGEYCDGHSHNFDHTSIILKGSVRIKRRGLNVDGAPIGEEFIQDFQAPSHVLIKARTFHLITALEDNTLAWCVYSHRTSQGEVTQENTGYMEAYQ